LNVAVTSPAQAWLVERSIGVVADTDGGVESGAEPVTKMGSTQ
jgi:hypothetical protein